MTALPPALDTALRSMVFYGTTELELQDEFEKLLKQCALPYRREVHIGVQDGKRLIIDFLLDSGEGIELKIKGATSSVVCQLHHYARCDSIKSIFLVTCRSKHAPPGSMCGKDVGVYKVRTW